MQYLASLSRNDGHPLMKRLEFRHLKYKNASYPIIIWNLLHVIELFSASSDQCMKYARFSVLKLN